MTSRLAKWGIGGLVATAMGVATVNLVGPWEGLRLDSYKDIVGVWTICYGETKGVGPNMRETKEGCDKQFIVSLVEHEQDMRKCLKDPDAIPIRPYIAYVSLTYNIGARNFCKSSMPRLINDGKYDEACDFLLVFNRAGGKVVQGLVNRRQAERKYCRSGLEG
jgi:lysozyme